MVADATGVRSTTVTVIVCGQDRDTTAAATAGTCATRLATSAVSIEASGAPMGTAAALTMSVSGSVEMPSTCTPCTSRSRES